jgi:choline dehydrogenase-like flavoprotein
MILDYSSDEVPKYWETQIAIVGTGPAGLTLARELSQFASVVLLEAGGLESSGDSEELLGGECVGLDYPLTQTRARQFGGSSSLWAGYCAQFDPIDFETREFVPKSGWPFDIEAIRPYYTRVAHDLNLEASDFDFRNFRHSSQNEIEFDEKIFVPSVWRFGNPTKRFGDALLPYFVESRNISTLTNAVVVDIRLDNSHSAVTELIIRSGNGREGRVRASLFVLACGGIETPRLLLNADTQTPGGLGNATGLVGRCFMEHPHRCIDGLHLRDDRLEQWTRRSATDEGKQFTFCLGLSQKAQENAGLMNARAHVYRTPQMADGEPPRVGIFLEQAPNLESRVSLSDTSDAFGMRRVRLDWRLNENDWNTYVGTSSLIIEEFERLGLGRFVPSTKHSTRDKKKEILHSNHHLGTTRMTACSDGGVVDSNCRVHDLENIYIVGGGVFPTVSWANPTFTVLALTYRLAHYLRKQSHSL